MDTKKENNILEYIDSCIYEVLLKSKQIMPKRLGKLIAMYYTDARIRKLYASFIGVSMGEGTYANLGLKCVPNENDICVRIGSCVSIAPNVTFVCCSSANNGTQINDNEYVSKVLTKSENIIVEDNVWIGAGATILPGVTIGECSVIGASSLVIDDVESYSVYAGIPAKKIRDLR